MPILTKTMRDLWDKERKKNKKQSLQQKAIPALPEEFQYHFRDYIARRRAFGENKAEMAKIFSEYIDRLGDAGFLEISK